VEEFLAALSGLTTCEAVMSALMKVARPFGMDCVAVGELPSAGSTRLKPFFHTTWPKSWFDIYAEQGIGSDDPIVTTARGARMPFSWTDIRDNLERWNLTRRDLRGFDLALEHGWSDGLAVPIHGPDGYHGLVSYAGNPPRLGPLERAALQSAALFAHDRMLSLHEADADGRRASTLHSALSPREVETIRLLASGLTDREIAGHFGVAERTALHYVARARAKLGCRTRAQLMAEAIRGGVLLP